MNGNVTEIGGLDLKILGAIKAGVKEILFPVDNMKDYNNFVLEKQIGVVYEKYFCIYMKKGKKQYIFHHQDLQIKQD